MTRKIEPNSCLYEVDKKIGIGTSSPASSLSVAGGASIGADYAIDHEAPEDGLIVQGNVGIGIDEPKAELDVEGNVKAGKVYSENARMEATARGQISTTSDEFCDMDDMEVVVDTGNRPLFILFVVSEAWVSKSWAYYSLLLDNKEIGAATNHFVSRHSSVVILRMPEVREGPHTIKVRWRVEKGETAKSVSQRTLTVIEY